ncbi:hypothetical protein AC578_2105 [Pseudocercospora eumusae]|uniref:Uncharacterized protein n=1 Tax=Pseudocercospora eumusae TaxID=321146 RepID=A0A139HQH9_9PEZI|nr:hypothetical protein AC578_2105 [Pseudocercospora eumusae]
MALFAGNVQGVVVQMSALMVSGLMLAFALSTSGSFTKGNFTKAAVHGLSHSPITPHSRKLFF